MYFYVRADCYRIIVRNKYTPKMIFMYICIEKYFKKLIHRERNCDLISEC